jgi:hypothetical protein
VMPESEAVAYLERKHMRVMNQYAAESSHTGVRAAS